MQIKKNRAEEVRQKLRSLAISIKRAPHNYAPTKLLAVLTLTEAIHDLTIPERQEETLLFFQTDVATAALEVAFEGDRPPNDWIQDIFNEVFEEPPQVVNVPPGEIIEYPAPLPMIELCLKGGQRVTFEFQLSRN